MKHLIWHVFLKYLSGHCHEVFAPAFVVYFDPKDMCGKHALGGTPHAHGAVVGGGSLVDGKRAVHKYNWEG